MSARLGQLTLIITIIAVGYFIYASVQGSVKTGITFKNTTSSLETGLVGHWTFDGKDVDWENYYAFDKTSNSNDLNVDTELYAVPGVIGQAMKNPGTTWSAMHAYTYTNLDMGTGDLTISGWINIDKNDTNQTGSHEIFYRKGGYTNEGYEFFYDEGRIYIRICTEASACTTFSSGYLGSLIGAGWHQVATVVDRDVGVSFYLDGEFTGSSGSSVYDGSDISTTDPGRIGTYSALPHIVSFDDIRVYSRALSADEVTELYNLGAGNKVGKTPTVPALETGLVGHWTFDGTDMDWGSTTAEVQDVTGNSNDGNATNMNATSSKPGKIGQALTFDGVDDYINLGTSITYADTSQPFTMAFWIRLDEHAFDAGRWDWPATVHLQSTAANGFLAVISDRTGWAPINFGSNSTWVRLRPSVDFSSELLGRWNHIVITYNGADPGTQSNFHFYRNSEEYALVAGGNLDPTGNLTTIGKSGSYGGPDYTLGSFDDVRVYNRALSADEVAQLYSMGGNKMATTIKPPPLEVGLVGHWTFDGPDMDWGSTTAEVRDRSVSGIIGDINPAHHTAVSGVLGQAMHLDGALYETIYFYGQNDLELQTNDMTISTWIYINDYDASNNLGVVSKKYNYLGEGYRINCTSNHACAFYVCTSTSDCTNYQVGGVIENENEWFLLTAVIDRDVGVSFYRNGDFVGSTGSNVYDGTAIAGGRPFRLGASSGDYGNVPVVSFDDTRVYNRALLAAEVQQLYNLGN